MKTLLQKAFLNPWVRIVSFLAVIFIGWTIWESVSGRDWSALHAPATPLPKELSAHLAFSPDGGTLAGCSDDGKLRLLPLTLSKDSLSVGSPRVLTLPPNTSCAPFVWSPDGKRILMPHVLGTMEGAAPGFLLIQPEEKPVVRVMNLVGGVDPNIPPAWSPDGQQIAYRAGERTPERGGLWLLDLRRGAARQLRLGLAFSPVFSPDGAHVLFVEDTDLAPDAVYDRDMDDYPHIWTLGSVPVRGGTVKRLAKWTQGSLMPTDAALLTRTPNGYRYLRYFRSLHGSRFEIWEEPLQPGGNVKAMRLMEVRLERGHLLRSLAWSGDGQRFTYVDLVSDSGPNALKLADEARNDVRTVAPGSGLPSATTTPLGHAWLKPTLSSDGGWIAATRSEVLSGHSPDEAESHDHEHEEGETHLGPSSSVLLRLP